MVRRPDKTVRPRPRRRGWPLAAFLAVVALGPGCTTWREWCSGEFRFREIFHHDEAPLVALEKYPDDGDKRARALRAMREPKRYGGSDVEQNEAVAVLQKAATTERTLWARLSAIQALREFQDPRAVEGLTQAYYKANAPFFTPDTSTVIRCQSLEALGHTKQPAAVELLVKVLREPPPAPKTAGAEKQQKMDERVAAARALGNFKQYQAAEALVGVLKSDDEVAVRNKAHESLVEMTGERLPPDAQAWNEYLQHPERMEGRSRGGLAEVLTAGWWK